jgi:hypothetical protein
MMFRSTRERMHSGVQAQPTKSFSTFGLALAGDEALLTSGGGGGGGVESSRLGSVFSFRKLLCS